MMQDGGCRVQGSGLRLLVWYAGSNDAVVRLHADDATAPRPCKHYQTTSHLLSEQHFIEGGRIDDSGLNA